VCRTPLVKDCDLPGEEVCSTEYESECLTEQEIHEVTDDVVVCQTVVEEKCEDESSGYTTNTKCSKWPREVCSLSKQQTTKYTPLTKCTKVPVELCGPSGCGFKEGEEECIEKTQTVIGDRPEETCSLDPQVSCKHVTKLVPKLVEVENCFDVPKEICVRSEVNPRKVKKPVIKKWCYVVKCPKECEEAAARQQCPADCETYRGDNKCCYTEPPQAEPQCPDNCAAAYRRGEEEPSCKQYENEFRNCYLPCPTQCRDAVKLGDTDYSCQKYDRIPGCYLEPLLACDLKPSCADDAQKGICSNECYSLYGPDSAEPVSSCCGTCPDLCKDYAREREMTYVNGTLDCADFADESCFFQCPDRCTQAYRDGESDESCAKYDSYLDKCYRPCPTSCEMAYKAGETDPSCEQYSDREKCYLPCPTKCSQDFSREVENPDCAQYSSVENCYYTPCESECQDCAREETTCPRTCEKYRGNSKCFYEKPECPAKCRSAFKSRQTDDSCKQYQNDFEMCYYTPCEEECLVSASRNENNPNCKQYVGNPICYIPDSTCPAECQQKALWGECPRQCKEYMGNPDCCAPTCPAKCTNKRRGECGAGGVPECDGIAGCCPEHFNEVFGAGVYLPPPADNS